MNNMLDIDEGMLAYNYADVEDIDGNHHGIDIYTASSEWSERLHATRIYCEQEGIDYKSAIIGGNFWSANEIRNS